MGSDKLIPRVPSQIYQMGFLRQSWRENHHPSNCVPSPSPAGTDLPLPFTPLWGSAWFPHGAWLWLCLHCLGWCWDPWVSEEPGATAHVDISAFKYSLVFRCIFFLETACLTRPHFLVCIPYLSCNYTCGQRLPVCETDFF